MRFALGLGILAIVQGCASQSVSIRSLPPEHPAAENAASARYSAGVRSTFTSVSSACSS